MLLLLLLLGVVIHAIAAGQQFCSRCRTYFFFQIVPLCRHWLDNATAVACESLVIVIITVDVIVTVIVALAVVIGWTMLPQSFVVLVVVIVTVIVAVSVLVVIIFHVGHCCCTLFLLI